MISFDNEIPVFESFLQARSNIRACALSAAKQQRVGLAPLGAETSLELTYRLKWSKSLEFGAYGAMRYQAGHNAQLGVRPEWAAVVRGTF